MRLLKSFLITCVFITSAHAYQTRAERIAACGPDPFPYTYACPGPRPTAQCDSTSALAISIKNYKTCVALAEQTNFAEGEVPTFTNAKGSFTYYYSDGTPVPAGTRIFLGLDPRGGYVLDAQGRNSGILIYDTRERAKYETDRAAYLATHPEGTAVGGGLVNAIQPVSSQQAITLAQDPARLKIIDDAAAASEANATAPVCSGLTTYSMSGEPEEVEAAVFVGARLMTRIMGKCKATGDALPPSVSKWMDGIRTYADAEETRSRNYTIRVDSLKSQVDSIMKNPNSSSSLQTAAVQMESELFIFTIESLSERVKLREAMIVSAQAAVDANFKENDDIVKTYQQTLIADGLDKALDIAKKACATNTVTTCTDAQDPSTCSSEVKPLVQGCSEAQAEITAIRTGKVQTYGENYLSMSGPSKALNDKCLALESDIDNLISRVQRSSNSNFNWLTPMKDGIKAMQATRKLAGLNCKSTKDELKKISDFTGSDAAGVAHYNAYLKADQLIGLPFKRADYLKPVLESLKSSICYDKAAIVKAQKSLTTLIKYNKAIDLELE
jgi:hypothetical protein